MYMYIRYWTGGGLVLNHPNHKISKLFIRSRVYCLYLTGKLFISCLRSLFLQIFIPHGLSEPEGGYRIGARPSVRPSVRACERACVSPAYCSKDRYSYVYETRWDYYPCKYAGVIFFYN